MWKRRISSRYAHNRVVLSNFHTKCRDEIKSNCWANDISEEMVQRLTHSISGTFIRFFTEAIKELK